MQRLTHYLDPWSIIVLAITLVLFAVALFVKGFTHDLLLEAGVFLVSMKLIMMMYTNGANARKMEEKIERIQAAVEQIARQSSGRRDSGASGQSPQ